ncbi:MAG: OsmC family protein [Pseudomonadota bacterium]
MNVQIETPFRNGVNVTAILEAREALEAAPEAAQFTWRAACEWVDGVHSRSTIEGFFGLGEEQRHDSAFAIDADHPTLFAASDHGATPVEIVLGALGSCLMAGLASVAENRGITLRSATATVEGDMDLSGILGIDPETRNGFSDIRVRFDIDADASPEDIAALAAQAQKRSAVFDVIANPSAVTVSVR